MVWGLGVCGFEDILILFVVNIGGVGAARAATEARVVEVAVMFGHACGAALCNMLHGDRPLPA